MRNKYKLVTKGLSLIFVSIGLIMILVSVAPVFTYNLFASEKFVNFISPLPDSDNRDYTKVSDWFEDPSKVSFKSSISFYNLSIPKLGIKDAVVSIGGEDLADSLIQYPGTALPGKEGNAVVFGHSALPAFYNPREYLTIFSTLPTLTKGDKISLVFDGISYTYEVNEMEEVLPTNLSVLKQTEASKILSLVTCVPPGDPRSPRRLVVRAKLIEDTTYDNNRI